MITTEPSWVMRLLSVFALVLVFLGLWPAFGGALALVFVMLLPVVIPVFVLSSLAVGLVRRKEWTMFGKKNGKVLNELIDHAQSTLEKAEKRQAEFAKLPDIGKVPEFREMLDRTTMGLRRALQLPVGAEMQHQVVQWLVMVSEAMVETEATKYAYAIEKNKSMHEAAKFGFSIESMLLGAKEGMRMLELYETELPYKAADFNEAFENYIKQGTALEMHTQHAKRLGIELPPGFPGPLQGMESLEPPRWDPSRALEDGGDDWEDDDVPDADSRAEYVSDSEKDVIDGSFADKEMGEMLVRVFSPDDDGEQGANGREYPEILWDKAKEKNE